MRPIPGLPVSNSIPLMTAKALSQSTNFNSSKKRDLSHASFATALNNQFTGNLDYKRSIESAVRAEKFSAREAARAREWSADQARILREWQAEMSNTAYSRAVADLKRVGINPYAIGLFNQLSTPSGASGQSFMAQAFTGNTFNSGSAGFHEVSQLVQTLFKEYMSYMRTALNAASSMIRF